MRPLRPTLLVALGVLLAASPEAHGDWEWSGPYGKLQSRGTGYLHPLDAYQSAEARVDLELEQSIQVSGTLAAEFVF